MRRTPEYGQPLKPRARARWCAWLATAVAAALCVACSSVQVRYPDGSTETQTRAEFEIYVERVFRYHNRVVNDLIIAASLLDEEILEMDGEVVRAEELMSERCHPLNDVVSASIEGREIGFFQKLALPQVVPACEAASRDLEALLPSI